jgi:hypothetical protein
VGQLAEWLGWLGSRGGPDSLSTPLGIAVLLTPSLLLGSSFLVLMVSVHHIAAPDRKVWSQAAIAFATAYTVLISIVYYVQLTLVAPRMSQGRLGGIETLLFVPFDSFLYAVDILGYSFMSVATLFPASCARVPDSERTAAAVPGAADVLSCNDLDRIALGDHISSVDVVVGHLFLPDPSWRCSEMISRAPPLVA